MSCEWKDFAAYVYAETIAGYIQWAFTAHTHAI